MGIAAGEPDYDGAQIFSQRCGGCHTLEMAGTQGSGNRTLREQGPNLDQRKVDYDTALYAIRNGGISGSIMPQNIVVGAEADAVAKFIANYSGTQAVDSVRPSPNPSEDQTLQQQEDSQPNQGTSAPFDSNG